MRNPLIYRYKLLFVIVLVLLLLVPFLNKAFHIDDTVVLYSARQIIETSLLGFSGATINWLGRPQSLRALSDSPLISQYTALIIRLLGENEFCLHTFFLIFPIIATISMYFLSKRFTSYPLISTLLLISTPSFIVSATNIMPDFALLAFYLAAVCTFVYGIDKEDKLLLIVSGFLVTLASLTKYTGLTVIPLLFFYAILKRRLSKGLLALSISFALLGIWYLRDFILFNKIQIVEGLWQFSPTLFSTISNLFSSLTYIGSVTVFPLLFLFLLQKKRDWFIYLLIIWLSTILLIPWLLKLKYTTFEIILSIFSISISIFILQKFIEFLKRKSISNYPDIIFLLTWLIGIFCHSIFILTWLTAPRYILMLIPPLILLLMKRYEILLFQSRGIIFRNFIYISIALNLLLSVLIAYADYSYANTYRDFTQTYIKYLKEMDKKVWFRGHWGFQYYMEKEGFTYLGLDDKPKKGEIIITPTICDHEPFSSNLKERLRFIGSIKYESWYPIRTISPKDGISFYSYAIGSLPYGISQEPLEVFQIWQVE